MDRLFVQLNVTERQRVRKKEFAVYVLDCSVSTVDVQGHGRILVSFLIWHCSVVQTPKKASHPSVSAFPWMWARRTRDTKKDGAYCRRRRCWCQGGCWCSCSCWCRRRNGKATVTLPTNQDKPSSLEPTERGSFSDPSLLHWLLGSENDCMA